jgi:aspartate racemase
LEIFGPLLNGAKLEIFPSGPASHLELGAFIRKSGITVAWLTAGLFHRVVDDCMDELKGLRVLLAGGDVLSVAHVNQVLKHLDCEMVNGYGPTENTTFTCCYRMKGGRVTEGSVPIGIPVSNTQVYILDEWMKPVPVGVEGELYAAGDGLAVGYWRNDQLTREKFVESRFCPGIRLYRTGDLCRYLSDGRIEFRGRLDGQVKIRGYRVETGEIETAILSFLNIQKAVVVAREDLGSEKILVGYLVAAPNAKIQIEDLRSFLLKRLPDYMVPRYFVEMDQFPLTENGKVDRRNLPSPERRTASEAEELVLPRNELEKTIARVWSEILKVDGIGIHENFFELGGDSLSATRVISRLKALLKIEVPLKKLFEGPTIEKLALLLNAVPSHSSQEKIEVFVPVEHSEEVLTEVVSTLDDVEVAAMLGELSQPKRGHSGLR